jgi:hypothetical protein
MDLTVRVYREKGDGDPGMQGRSFELYIGVGMSKLAKIKRGNTGEEHSQERARSSFSLTPRGLFTKNSS